MRKKFKKKCNKSKTETKMKNLPNRRYNSWENIRSPRYQRRRRNSGNKQNQRQYFHLVIHHWIRSQRNPSIRYSNLHIGFYSEEAIEVDGFNYPPSIIISPNQILNWELRSMDEVTIEHFKIIEVVFPPPTYLIIGCTKPDKFPPEIRKYLDEVHGNYDIL